MGDPSDYGRWVWSHLPPKGAAEPLDLAAVLRRSVANSSPEVKAAMREHLLKGLPVDFTSPSLNPQYAGPITTRVPAAVVIRAAWDILNSAAPKEGATMPITNPPPRLRPLYSQEVIAGVTILRDVGGSCSITNGAEQVARDLDLWGLPARRVVYRDTEGRWDGLAIAEGRFQGFVSLGCTGRCGALVAALTYTDRRWLAGEGFDALFRGVGLAMVRALGEEVPAEVAGPESPGVADLCCMFEGDQPLYLEIRAQGLALPVQIRPARK